MNNDQIIFRLTFPFVQTESILDFIQMRRADVAKRRENATTVAVLRGCKSEDGVLGALEVQFQELHDSMLFGDYNSGTCGVVMSARLHEWLHEQMLKEVSRHDELWKVHASRADCTGFAATEKHMWEQLTNLVSEFIPYEGDATDTRLVQDDPGFDRLLQEVA